MSSKIRKYVRELERGERVPELLPDYVKEYMCLHDRYARINLMMEYYMFYETVSEGINPYIETAKETAETFHRLLFRFLNQPSPEEVGRTAEELLTLRAEVVDIMQVLTAYVDCFTIYEYILNRVQFRFEDMEMVPSDEEFARELVNYIFSSEDNAIISDNIRFVMGQLPMRITRSKYYDMIRDSISVYQGSEKGSLEGFLFMFRSSAMLSQDENQKKYLTEFVPILTELWELDYDNISSEAYTVYAEKIHTSASKLSDVGDLYMQLGELINGLYVLCKTSHYAAGERTVPEADRVLRGINALFTGQESSVWQEADNLPVDSEEEKLYWLEEQFVLVEGRQEQLLESLNTAGAALESIQESYRDNISAMGLAGDFAILNQLVLFTSDSIFADLEEVVQEEKVTQEMADRAAAELIEDCKRLFQGKSRLLRRAVMANTIDRMPVFFNSAQEVADYITGALIGCNDEAEKYAAKQLLMDSMV